MRAIVTRPEPDGPDFAEKLNARGVTTILSPVMDIVPVRRELDFTGVGALAFTSANGVRAVAAVRPPPGLPVFAVGAATEEAARANGHCNIKTAKGDVDSLADVIVAAHLRRVFKGAVLHAAGAARAGDLVRALQDRGVLARREVLYEARPRESLSREAEAALAADPPAEWAVLFSPRSARLFLDQVRTAGLEDRLQGVGAACLSAAVAEAARAARWREVRAARVRDSEGMIDLLAAENDAARS
ncbi:MAG: uroporphyrinogen-III synthase [Parvularculaceae bacterium]